ncbi:galactitol-1-phosphate 5-dehydrogenase [Oceanobacillus sp. CFH 90083]|uniref:galactitol-1-phosphate 5-dehydrogenase n=1 Tax=Oceanobacillus sp. CFH 90083 TaxID=2592336 RepID=UPI00128CA944|nr:galactitol-1-phosphate 5-dehydrogenase [Oceanobacillus sp. CFH 90083]
MKALNLYDIEDIRFEENTPVPQITSNDEVLIQVKSAGVCGSDLSRYKKLGPYVPGTTFGHEFSGVISAVGSAVTQFKEGDRVAACPAFSCGECNYCRQGAPTRCTELTVIGAKHPGAYAEYVTLPASHVLQLPGEIDFDAAAMLEPSSVVLHGFYRTSIQPGAAVAIMGIGSIGLLSVQWAKIFGAEIVFAIDIDENKLKTAKQLGADIAINPLEEDTEMVIKKHTAQSGVDLAVESAGSPATSEQVLSLPKKGGEVLYLGIPYGDITLQRYYFEKIVRNELRILGSWNALSAPFPGKEWKTALHYMKTGQLDVKPMISHHFPLNMGPEIFHQLIYKEIDAIKVLFHP